jgi:hypothetical protein
MNGLTAENVRLVTDSLKEAIGDLKKENQRVAATELESVLAVVDQMQRDNTSNTTQASRPDRVGDECWYAASNDPYKRGILRAWLGGQYEGHAVAVEDVETKAIRYVDYISFSTEAPK